MLNESEFEQILGEITFNWSQRNLEKAFGLIDKVALEGNSKMKAQALFFKGMIKAEQDHSSEAESSWLEALSSAPPGSFLTYSLQAALGNSYEAHENLIEAKKWYRSALKTCAEGDEFSGNKVLFSLLNLNGKIIPPEDEDIVSKAVQKSWRVLELSGVPDLSDLPSSIISIDRHFHGLLDSNK